MNALLGALVLFLLGVLGVRFSFTGPGTPIGWRFFFVTGTHFLIIGLLLGPYALELLTPAVLGQLYPLLALGLGWVGLLFGLQFDRHQLTLLTPRLVALAVLQATFAFLAFLAIGMALFASAGALHGGARAALAAAAATACVSSPLGIAVVSNFLRERGRLTELLLLIASLDAVVGIVALQLAFAFYNPNVLYGAGVAAAPLTWLALALALGISFGIIFLWLTRPKPTREELTLFVLGIAMFLSGAALHLGLSTLFVGMVAGAVIANLSPLERRVFNVLQGWEKSIYVVLLVLMGAMIDLATWLIVPLAIGYTAVRLVAKLLGGWAAARLVARDARPPALIGLGLAAQGGMSLVLVLSVTLSFGALGGAQPAVITLLVSTVVLGVILSELLGPFLTRHLLRRTEGGMRGDVIVPREANAR
ncbi:MAG TPA: cation:proton antiporter [Longimicrobiales bacterium]|nr:cation:proton antiporter [Longimicrobiales bacterium]